MVDTVENPQTNTTHKQAEKRDPSLPDPLVLHHSDTPSLTLTKAPLDGRNYGEWSRSMRLALSAKNKIGLITGFEKAPPTTDPRFHLWRCCNDLVLTWILNSVEPDIARSVIYIDSVAAVWNDLHDRFSQGDDSRIYDTRQEITEWRQYSRSVSAYHTKLKALWDELDSHQEPIACSCDMLKIIAAREEKEKVVKFLMELNESYAQVRGSILMMKPLPDTRKTHSLILQQERQMEVAIRRETHLSPHAMLAARTPMPTALFPSTFNRKAVRCSHYEQDGHSIDRCYYLIGFPVGHKWHGKNMKPMNKKSAVVHNIETKSEEVSGNPTFTQEEYKQIMALLQYKNGNDRPFENVTGIFTPTCNNIEHDAHSTLYWILDSGATDHVSHVAPMHNKSNMAHKFVGLPNGEQARIESIGSVKLSSYLTLDKVLYVPKFRVNLISVCQASRKGVTPLKV